MRIVLVNGTRRKVGGVESYLEQLIPGLLARGDEVAVLCESGASEGTEAMQIPASVPVWQVDPINCAEALTALRVWQPDVVFLHSPVDLELKNQLLSIAPGVFFAHNYHGTCISGTKRHAFPKTRPCDKVFSSACLAHYFPRRCGGLNPVTMIQRYRAESAWLTDLRGFAGIVVASEHMADEYRKHGFGHRVHVVGLPVRNCAEATTTHTPPHENEPWRLLFIGRMESYKGGMILLDALPTVQPQLGQSIQLNFVGDGRERRCWEEHARRIVRDYPKIEVKFTGWLSGDALQAAIKTSHLLVFPSVWPEPFGLVGLEAGAYGLPTAAFEVGGIGDWLKDGVNGHLAPGDPPTAHELAGAICRAVSDPANYAALSSGALRTPEHFSLGNHVDRMMAIFDRVTRSN